MNFQPDFLFLPLTVKLQRCPAPLNSSATAGSFLPMIQWGCAFVFGPRSWVSLTRHWTLRSWGRAVVISCFAAASALFPPSVASRVWCSLTAGSTANRKRSCIRNTFWVVRLLSLVRCFVVSLSALVFFISCGKNKLSQKIPFVTLFISWSVLSSRILECLFIRANVLTLTLPI